MSSPGESPISVLCVDGEPGSDDPIGPSLERVNDRLSVISATDAADAVALLAETDVDCVVSEYDVPDTDGISFLKAVRDDYPALPFILFTDSGSEAIASDAIGAGVTDYVPRDATTERYRDLARRITDAVDRARPARRATTGTEHAETVLDASPNGILVAIDGRCVYANPTGIALLTADSADETATGSRDDVVGRSVTAFFHRRADTGDASRPVGSATDVFEAKRLRLTTTAGREIPVEATARRITWGDADAVVYVFREISDRIAYEAELEYQRSILDSTFEASPDGILVTTDERELVSYNDRFADLWKLPRDLLDSGDLERVREAADDRVEDTVAFRELLEAQYERNEPQYTSIRLVDGTVLNQYAAPIALDGDEESGHVWFYRDVTELRELERAQKEAYARMTDAVYSVDTEWEVTFVNDQAGTLLERDPDDLLGTTIWDAFPDVVGTEIHDRLVAALETSRPVSFETEYDPLDSWFEIRAFPSETGMTVYFRDITEERKTRLALRESVDALRRLYEVTSASDTAFDEKRREILTLGTDYLNMPGGYVTEVTDATQTVVAAAGDTGARAGDSWPLEESYCRGVATTESDVLAIDDATADGRASDSAPRSGPGSYIGGRVLVDGEVYGTVCFASSDARPEGFTDMERAFVELLSRWLSYEQERELQQTRLEATNAQLAEFASVVSHDLRNPLNVASGRLALAREERDGEHLRIVDEAHTRMQQLITDILTLATDGNVIDEVGPVALGSLCERCWTTVDTRNAELVVESDGAIAADERRLSQVLENLFRNAVEHGSTSSQRGDRADDSVEHGGADVTVTVGDLDDGFYLEDDGAGIADADGDALFDAGFSTKSNGTGIGLRIVERIADAHGWNVTVTDGADGGARFEFTGVERVRERDASARNP